MRVGLIGTGAIAKKHAQAYRNIGFQLVACTNRSPGTGQQFADHHRIEFVAETEVLCAREDLDFIDVCTWPESDCRSSNCVPVMAVMFKSRSRSLRTLKMRVA